MRTSVLLRGIEGFGIKHRLQTERLLTLSEDLPLLAIALDTPARIEAVLEQVRALSPHGAITLERARLLSDLAAPWSWVRTRSRMRSSSPSTSGVASRPAAGRRTSLSLTACAGMGWRARACCSGWTAPCTACAVAGASSRATRTCR